MPKITTKNLTTMALLIALEIILSRFLSLSAWNTKIGFSFVPVVIAAILLGPVYAGIVGALADFVGAILFPIGAYFPGFTLTAFLTGMVFGLFLYKQQSLPRILGAVAVNQFILSLLLNTLWISVLYGSPFGPLLVTRLVQSGILTVVQIVVIELIVKALPRLRRGFST
ncbi:MAG: folate family ECF transporter S component [Oscillospiraceae bacterium]|nr:folate family ECF transporter S component [Oscillospiraceae bacterium]